MKFVSTVLVLALIAWVSYACEFHRRQEEARRQAERAAALLRDVGRQQLRLAQERAYDDVRQSVYVAPSGGSSDMGSHSIYSGGSSRPVYSRRTYSSVLPTYTGGDGDSSHVGSHSRHSGGSSRPVYSRRTYSSVLPTYTGGLPANHKFCGTTEEYYCHVNATCVRSYSGAAWKCRTTQTHTIQRRPVISSHSYDGRGSRYYPYHRRPIGGEGSYIPTYSHTRYTCRTGLVRVNITSRSFGCEDINECETGDHLCEGTCINKYAGYYCGCDKGYKIEEKYKCVDIDECVEYENPCLFASCQNTEGSYTCECPEGYVELGTTTCDDINECDGDPCAEGEVCLNNWGNYSCEAPQECPEGYETSNRTTDSSAACFLTGEADGPDVPTSISYRRIMMRHSAVSHGTATRLGTLSFSGQSGMSHRYNVKILKGKNYFWYRRRYAESSDKLTIDFFSRRALPEDSELPFSLLITDRATRRVAYTGYYYKDYETLPESRREIAMTILTSPAGL